MNENKKFVDIVSYAAASAVFSILILFYSSHINSNRAQIMLEGENAFSPQEYFGISEKSLSTSAQACALTDANSGQIIYSKNENLKLPMASTTKIMTAIIALENCDLDETVTITESSAGIEGSSIYLAIGEKLTVGELLYGLMLESGNDAASALAIHTAGNVESFCRMMNDKAKEIGLANTHFENPHGLSSQEHYTTASDLSLLTAYALKNNSFRKIVSTENYVINERADCAARYFSNHNRLLKSLDICTGVKTGYTIASGRCLVTSCETESGRFVAVTLNDRNDWKDHESMLTFASENFESIKIADKNELVFSYKTDTYPKKAITASNSTDIYITRKKGDCSAIDISVEIAKARPTENNTAGYVTVNCNGVCFRSPLNITSG